jgi:hypothetical protein
VNLWGNPITRRAEYFVYHDEGVPNKRWLLIGLAFVKKTEEFKVQRVLRCMHRQENYQGEMHFSALPKSFCGQFGAKARLARRYMEDYQDGLADLVNFSCLAVDWHSPAYEHHRFSRNFHAYNRFTAMALKAGVAWHLRPLQLDKLSIHFVSDAKERVSRLDQGFIDNFEDYLPYRAELDAFLQQQHNRSYPSVELNLELQDSVSDDLLQLCDLLLGATQMALVAASKTADETRIGADGCPMV